MAKRSPDKILARDANKAMRELTHYSPHHLVESGCGAQNSFYLSFSPSMVQVIHTGEGVKVLAALGHVDQIRFLRDELAKELGRLQEIMDADNAKRLMTWPPEDQEPATMDGEPVGCMEGIADQEFCEVQPCWERWPGKPSSRRCAMHVPLDDTEGDNDGEEDDA